MSWKEGRCACHATFHIPARISLLRCTLVYSKVAKGKGTILPHFIEAAQKGRPGLDTTCQCIEQHSPSRVAVCCLALSLLPFANRSGHQVLSQHNAAIVPILHNQVSEPLLRKCVQRHLQLCITAWPPVCLVPNLRGQVTCSMR